MKKFMVVASTILAFAGAAGNALAQSGDFPRYRSGGVYEDFSYSKKPRRGYSGWSGPPIRGLYCDYRRNPIRECKPNGRCKVVKWELEQYCY